MTKEEIWAQLYDEFKKILKEYGKEHKISELVLKVIEPIMETFYLERVVRASELLEKLRLDKEPLLH
jgi:hypothetical protein